MQLPRFTRVKNIDKNVLNAKLLSQIIAQKLFILGIKLPKVSFLNMLIK